ncbi:hypothetical protein DACRYDRAFT_48060 [Dacryopinax primogenitus]|uniref:VOC domain-containing protein n=1 Tax=Dacryopinax primogenitus (strain DJM 731) TaxID=1858805 RepID=M5G8J7_DACPD|nr:uncharacterized protein DACRYDRAFT_48060 [Dacryopinax primogenitus]EJU05074.1 hypothetical protein DACRYDRAFT_48060 [Dacryopinax primogenitus]
MSTPAVASPIPPLSGLHHIKLPVSSLSHSLVFYTQILGFTHIPAYDHYDPSGKLYAHILRLSANAAHPAEHKIPITHEDILLELRLAPETAPLLGENHVDILTLSAPSSTAITAWSEWLTQHSVPNSGTLRGLVGELVVCEDPDGLRVRVYSTEMPDGGMDPQLVSKDEKWLD